MVVVEEGLYLSSQHLITLHKVGSFWVFPPICLYKRPKSSNRVLLEDGDAVKKGVFMSFFICNVLKILLKSIQI